MPELDFDLIGPGVGDRCPDIRLPDQQARVVDLPAQATDRHDPGTGEEGRQPESSQLAHDS
jgi:hypothetical protein